MNAKYFSSAFCVIVLQLWRDDDSTDVEYLPTHIYTFYVVSMGAHDEVF